MCISGSVLQIRLYSYTDSARLYIGSTFIGKYKQYQSQSQSSKIRDTSTLRTKKMLCDSCGHVNDEAAEFCSLCHYSWIEHKHIQIEGKSKQIKGYSVKKQEEDDEHGSYFNSKYRKKWIKAKRRKRMIKAILIIISLAIGASLILFGIDRKKEIRRENEDMTRCIVTKSWVDKCNIDTGDGEQCYSDYKYYVNLMKTENNGTDYKCLSYNGSYNIYCEHNDCKSCNNNPGYSVGQTFSCWINCDDFSCSLQDPWADYWESVVSIVIGIMCIVIPLCVTLCCVIYFPLQKAMTP